MTVERRGEIRVGGRPHYCSVPGCTNLTAFQAADETGAFDRYCDEHKDLAPVTPDDVERFMPPSEGDAA